MRAKSGQLRSAIRSFVQTARSRIGQERTGSAISLLPLTPRYDPDKHVVYFDAIQEALHGSKNSVLNVALTGSYGVGKSSILGEVARRNPRNVIVISLSTLGFSEALPTRSTSAASSRTNRIQKEIVKQLLYSQDPHKMPGSRYRRMTRFRFWRGVGLALLLATPVTILFYLAGWTRSLSSLAPLPREWDLLPNVEVFVGATVLLVSFLAVFHNRVQIDKISAGSATIALSAKSPTYFDEYLDEIVYFFEVVRRNVVIFEDIDRFDDAHIFETLRSLNSILNGARQLRGRRIRFIYAIKDSIFDELGARAAREELDSEPVEASVTTANDAAEAEVARANRTKFFDLVIPVVPFVTHRSARDHIVETMRDVDHSISNELIDLAARHVADMRLIKNVRNEFAIFKSQVLRVGGLELSEDKLFAMILYKNIHLEDFELIKLGKSGLDGLYSDSRELVIRNVNLQARAIREARAARGRIRIAAEHANDLGASLLTHIKVVGFDRNARGIQQVALNGSNVALSALQSPDFWEKLASEDGTLTVTYPNINGYVTNVDFSRADIEQALGETISSREWVDQQRATIDARISKAASNREFLTRASMQELIQRPEFTIQRGGTELSLADVAASKLSSELAVQLVTAGFIDRNFTLYTSTFHGQRISANATNFIMKNVEPNLMDPYFLLSGDDVEAVLLEKGAAVLRERSPYNVSFLNHLLAHRPTEADLLLDRLQAYAGDERDFLLAYLDSGSERERMVSRLAASWPRILAVLVIDAELDDRATALLVDVVLQNLAEQVTYDSPAPVRDYLVGTYQALPAFTSDVLDPTRARALASLLKQSGARLPLLGPLGTNPLEAIVEEGSYEITRENLRTALGERVSLSLDGLAGANRAVYATALENLGDYLAALREDEDTVIEGGAFARVLKDVAKHDSSHLSAVISRASRECELHDLNSVPEVVWPLLAEERRFLLTFSNLQSYLINGPGIDSAMADFLKTMQIAEPSTDTDESDKVSVAQVILRSQHELDAGVRAHLVASLSLKDYLAPDEVPRESGPLVGHLLHEDLVEDSLATFQLIDPADFSGLEFAIANSESFAGFMTPELVTPANLVGLVRSNNVSESVKRGIVNRFAEFTSGAPRDALLAIADYAVRSSQTLEFDQVLRLARERTPAPVVLDLLQPHLASRSLEDLQGLLRLMGGTYAELAERNGKRPRIPFSSANKALTDRLSALGLVSSVSARGRELRVNMKQPL